MDNAVYTTLTRQSGLMAEMQAVANNIANASTTGYRREGVIFAEFVAALAPDDPSLSMATAEVRDTGSTRRPSPSPAAASTSPSRATASSWSKGRRAPLLTRAGSFTPSPRATWSPPMVYRLLDAGGAPVFVPADAGQIAIAADGTMSADGQPLTQIGLWAPADPTDLSHRDGVRFAAPGGTEPVIDGGKHHAGLSRKLQCRSDRRDRPDDRDPARLRTGPGLPGKRRPSASATSSRPSAAKERTAPCAP
jgi:flagellar basal-body rod protein FlgF